MNKINKIKEKLESAIASIKHFKDKEGNAYFIAVGRASAYQECLEILEREKEDEK